MWASRAWGRLLWKEFRQGWLVVILLLVASPVGFLVAQATDSKSSLHGISVVLGWVGTPLLAALWAAAKANRAAPASGFLQSHLPISVLPRWVTAFFLPLLIVTLGGALYGAFATLVPGYTYGTLASAGQVANVAAACVASTFAICFLVATSLSLLPGLLAAAICCTLTAAVVTESLHVSRSSDFEAQVMPFTWRLALAAGVVSFLFAFSTSKRSARSQRRALVCVATVLVVTPTLVAVYWKLENRPSFSGQAWASPDGAVVLGWRSPAEHPDQVTFRYEDQRAEVFRERTFRSDALVVGVRDGRLVYLAAQPPGARKVAILLWDPMTDSIRSIASLRTGKKALRTKFLSNTFGHADPKGTYLVLTLPLPVLEGSARDLWVADLRSGTGTLVLPGRRFASERASWSGDSVILSGYADAVLVHLKTARAEFLPFPLPKRSSRKGGPTRG